MSAYVIVELEVTDLTGVHFVHPSGQNERRKDPGG